MNTVFLFGVALVSGALGAGGSDCLPLFTEGDSDYYEPSTAESCWSRHPLNEAEAYEAITAVEQMSEFYTSTDLSASSDPRIVQRVNLMKEMADLRRAMPQSRYVLHKAISKVIANLKDGHARYSVPSEYRGVLGPVVQFTSRIGSSGAQELVLHGFLPAAALGNWMSEVKPSGLVPGVVVRRINGEDAVSFLASWAYDNYFYKTHDAAFNQVLRSPEFRAGSRGERFMDKLVLEYEGAYGLETASTPVYFRRRRADGQTVPVPLDDPPSSSPSEVDLADDLLVFPLNKVDELPSGPKQQNNQKRGATPLASEDYWTRSDVEVISAVPSVEDPEILCAVAPNADGTAKHMYLFVSSFSFAREKPGVCGFLEEVHKRINVARACSTYAAAAEPRIDTLVLDVRQNGGGYLFYLTALLFEMSPRFWFGEGGNSFAEKLFGTDVLRFDPPSAAAVQDLFEVAVSENAAMNHGDAILRLYLGFSDLVDPATGLRLTPSERKDIFLRSQRKRRVPTAPERRVTQKVASVDAPYFAYSNAFGCSAELRSATLPTSGFERIAVLSLGLCGSACSRFLHLLQHHAGALAVTAGGLTDTTESHTTSLSPNGPVWSWNRFVDVNNPLPTTPNLTKLSTDAVLVYSSSSYFITADESLDRENDLQKALPDLSLPLWPPFTAEDEAEVVEAALMALRDPSFDTAASGWAPGSFTPSSVHVLPSSPPPLCPPSHPLFACGRCFVDLEQAKTGCGGGCPSTHPVYACSRCFVDEKQARSAQCQLF